MIDTHAHLISDDHARFPPSPPSGELRSGDLDDPMTGERLLKEMDAAGVEKAVLVQRGSVYGFDNRYVCMTAAEHPDRFTAVCAIDSLSDDGAEAVRRWVDAGAAGMRLMELVKRDSVDWLCSPSALAVWDAALSARVSMCVHFFPWNRKAGLKALQQILQERPSANVVIDHLSNMNVMAGAPDYGLDEDLLAVTAFPGVRLKFTTIPLGRLSEAGVDPQPIIQRIAAEIGSHRLMWGSDIGQSPGSYEFQAGLGRAGVRSLTEMESAAILTGSAEAVYGPWWR